VRCGAAICCRSTRTSSASHATGPKRCTCEPRRAAPLGFRHRYCVHLYLWYPWSTPSS
jgi:hypothetical protein